MLTETIADVPPFMGILVIIVATFANAFLILDHSEIAYHTETVEEYEPLLTPKTPDAVLDSVMWNYFLGLGDFGIAEEWSNETNEGTTSGSLIWVYFVMSTLLTNICILNILIAIISDTYARVTEAQEVSGL